MSVSLPPSSVTNSIKPGDNYPDTEGLQAKAPHHTTVRYQGTILKSIEQTFKSQSPTAGYGHDLPFSGCLSNGRFNAKKT